MVMQLSSGHSGPAAAAGNVREYSAEVGSVDPAAGSFVSWVVSEHPTRAPAVNETAAARVNIRVGRVSRKLMEQMVSHPEDDLHHIENAPGLNRVDLSH